MKTKSTFQTGLLILLACLFAPMCTNVDDEITPISIDSADPCINPVFFSEEIIPIFDQYCVLCHSLSHTLSHIYPILPYLSPSVAYDELIFGEYVNLEFPEQSILYLRVEGTSVGINMPPPGKLPLQKIQKILDWIKCGAPNN